MQPIKASSLIYVTELPIMTEVKLEPLKSPKINRDDGIGDGDRGQTSTTFESIMADRGDGVRDGDRSQTRATFKCTITDRGYGVGDSNRG